MTGWKKLTRADLTKFDVIATEVILTAMDRGGIGRVSNRGHATIRHPDGKRTMSVTRDSSLRKAQNMWGDLRKLFPEERDGTNGTTKEASMHSDLKQPLFTDMQLPTATTNGATIMDEPLLGCPVKKCDRKFATEGARYAHVRDDHVTCEWEGPDVEHDDPSYRCDFGPDGTAFVGDTKLAVAGHVNIRHNGNQPWMHRDPARRSESGKKASATKARKAAERAAQATKTEVLAVDVAPTPTPAPVPVPVPAPAPEPKQTTTVPEHRGLPSKAVIHKPMSDAAKLRAIRDLLGEDPRIAKLEAQLAELQAHLDLVREAVGLNDPKKKK